MVFVGVVIWLVDVRLGEVIKGTVTFVQIVFDLKGSLEMWNNSTWPLRAKLCWFIMRKDISIGVTPFGENPKAKPHGPKSMWAISHHWGDIYGHIINPNKNHQRVKEEKHFSIVRFEKASNVKQHLNIGALKALFSNPTMLSSCSSVSCSLVSILIFVCS